MSNTIQNKSIQQNRHSSSHCTSASEKMSSIVFFVWDNLLGHHLLLAKNLKAAGVEVTMIVQTIEAGEKCYQNRLDFAITDNIYKFFRIKEQVARWRTSVDKHDLTKIDYRGYNIWDICLYERNIHGRDGSPELSEEVFTKAAEAIELICRIIDHTKPHVLSVWNGLCLPTRAFAEVAKKEGIAVYYGERGFLPKTLVLDRLGINFGSTPSQTWNRLRESIILNTTQNTKLDTYFSSLHEHAQSIAGPTGNIGSKELRTQLELPEGIKIILYVAQIDNDTNIVFYSPQYKNNTGVIEKLCKIVSRHKDAHLLVKLHPEDVNRQREFEECLSGSASIVSDVGIQSLLPIVDIVVIRNSNVGLEALTYGKPVVVLGKAIYSHKGFTYDVSTDEEFSDTIAYLMTHHHDALKARDKTAPFFFHVLNDYLYFIDGNEVFERSNEKIKQKILEAARGVKNKTDLSKHVRRSFYEKIEGCLMNKIFNGSKETSNSLSSREISKILVIIYNVNLPYKILLQHLSSLVGKNGHITVIGHELLRNEELQYDKFYRFSSISLLRCLFKSYDLLVFTSFRSTKLRVLLYLLLCLAKQKILLNPFNLKFF